MKWSTSRRSFLWMLAALVPGVAPPPPRITSSANRTYSWGPRTYSWEPLDADDLGNLVFNVSPQDAFDSGDFGVLVRR